MLAKSCLMLILALFLDETDSLSAPNVADGSIVKEEISVLVEPILDNSYSRNPIKRISHALTNLQANEEQTILHDRSLKETGGVWKTKFLGRQAYGVSAYLPEITAELTKNEAMGHLKKSWPQSVIDILGKNSMIAGEGENFQKARKILLEAMSTKAILSQSVLPGIQEAVDNTFDHWKEVAETGETTSFSDDMREITYSVIITVVFGKDTLTKNELASLRAYTDAIAKGLFSIPIDKPVIRKLPFFRRYTRAMQARKDMKELISKKIASRKQAIQAYNGSNFEPSCVLDSFLTQGNLPEEQVVDFCVDNTILSIFAGYDTTASLSSNLILMLRNHATADERAQIRDELNAFDIQQIILNGSSLPPGGMLDAVPSLKSAAYESFRWRPVVGSTFQQTTAPITVGKVQIPANTTLQWAHLHGSKSSVFYEQSDRACPLRFLGTKELPPFVFGFGKHKCPGQFLAQIELLLAMKAFLCNFDFSLEPDQNTDPSIPFNSPKSGLKLQLTARE